jgi:uncharacterized Ntn-hydrolase superfamily protein
VTYSIVARDPDTGHMGVATHSQAFAVGSSVPWALAGHGVIATQSMGEPMYGELGLDALRGGLTAAEALTALRSVDPHPERRQVAMVDTRGGFEVYTGEACVAAAGHRVGRNCAALANMVASPAVWEAMVEAFDEATGSLAHRMLAALHAAEAEGGDFRGRRSAAIVIVRDQRTGRPWRDQVVDLRVDAHPDPVHELDRLVRQNDRYHQMVEAFQCALDDQCDRALAILEEMDAKGPTEEPDLLTWRAVVLALAGRTGDASAILAALSTTAPQFVEAIRRFGPAGLIPDPELLKSILPS